MKKKSAPEHLPVHCSECGLRYTAGQHTCPKRQKDTGQESMPKKSKKFIIFPDDYY